MNKKIIFPLLWMIFIFPFVVSADRFYINPVNLEVGKTETLQFFLENSEDCYGFQAEIKLPTGIEAIKKDNGELNITLSNRVDKGDYQVSSNVLPSGILIMGAFSASHKPISGKSGVLVNLEVSVTDKFEGGNLEILNAMFIDSQDNDVDLNSSSTPLGIIVTDISLNKSSLSLTEGDEETLTAEVLPKNATDKSITWSSSDETVATVDANGKITAKALGETTITATCGTATATCKVTVIPTPVESVTLSNTSLSLTEGGTATLTATVLPANATDKTITWSSSNESVATVSDDGIVTAVKAGTATITATSSNGLTAACTVIVAAKVIEATGVTLNKTELSLKEGETETLTATVAPADATDKTITWTSSDESVATVDASGKITAKALGETTITATCGTASATCTVKVIPTPVESVTLNKTAVELKVGETETLTATIAPENATDKTIDWTSSDESVATVDASGKITAKALGETTITATCGTASATCTVKVIPTPVESVTLSKTELSLTEGDTAALTATVTPDNATDKSVTWTSSDESVATVSAEGVVTAVKAGTATITASSSNGKTATCAVTVVAKIITVTSITLSTTDWSGIEGDSFKLTANVVPENATDNTVTWTSSNDKVATVDVEGNVKAVGVGEAIITATANDVSGVKAGAIIHVVEPGPKYSYNDDGTATVIGIWGTETDLIIPAVVTYNGKEYKITAIGDYAFSNKSDITSVSIPESLSKIGSKVFNGCSNLKEIRYLADDPVTADNDLFDEIVYLKAKLYVSPSTKDIIKNKTPWSKFTKTVGYLLGDANTDWGVDISDATTIANVAVGNEVDSFDAELADVNCNGEITISDALGAVRIILNQEVSASMLKIKGVDNEETVKSGYLIVNKMNVQNGTLDIAMNGTSGFVAVQADLYLREGMRLEGITTGVGASGHTVMYREVGKNVYRVVLFNFDGVEMDNNGETLLTLHISTEGDTSDTPIIRNILASDAKGIRHILGATQNQTTGAATLENDPVCVYVESGELKISGAEGELAAIYTTDGTLIGKYRIGSEVITLSPGIYIITVGKKTIKIFVK